MTEDKFIKNNDRNLLLKKLLYLSNYRGCKETDILLGNFAKNIIQHFSLNELNLYQDFIIEDDAKIYDWILNNLPIPEKYYILIDKIRKFHDLDIKI